MAGIMSMNTHLEGVLGFRGIFYLNFFYLLWSGSTMRSMSCQNISVYPASSDLLDMFPNLWCNNPKEAFFLGILFGDFDFSFVFTKNACFHWALCGNVTAFCLVSLENPMKTFDEKCKDALNLLT